MILHDLALPDEGIFGDVGSTTERVARLARELVEFYGRGQAWWLILTGDPAMAVAFERSAGTYEARFDALVRAALGRMADDAIAFAIVASVIGPPLHYALIARGLTPDQAVRDSLAMLLPWLEARERERGPRTGRGRKS